MKVYTKLFEEEEIETRKTYQQNSFRPSTYFPTKIILLLEKLPDTHYVIGPWYGTKNGNDYQIVVTGKCQYDESYNRAVYRELGEELRILPVKDDKNGYTFFDKFRIEDEKNKKYNILYSMNIIHTKNIVNEKKLKNYRDDKNRRISVIVYGTENNILQKMSQMGENSWGSSDNIKGVVAVPVKIAKQIVKQFL